MELRARIGAEYIDVHRQDARNDHCETGKIYAFMSPHETTLRGMRFSYKLLIIMLIILSEVSSIQ